MSELNGSPNPPFKQWIQKARKTDDPAGDFIRDSTAARALRLMPDDFADVHGLRNHMRALNPAPCREAFEASLVVWARYMRATPERKPISKKRRFEILRRDGFRCRLCGASAENETTLHVDHAIPVALGGTDEEANLWTLCADCNLGKGAEEVGVEIDRHREEVARP